MILQVMAVFDVKARSYARPFYVAHVDVGVRTFAEAANMPGEQICMHAEDFSLYHLGSWEDETGKFITASQPILICSALQWKKGSTDVQSKIA